MLTYKLFCTITMETYYIDSDSEYHAKQELALKIGCPLSCIVVWDR